MQVLNSFKFFEGQGTTSQSNHLHNVQGSILVLQVSGTSTDFSLQVYGKVDAEQNSYVNLQSINVSSYDGDSSITSNGIYNVSIDGISDIYLDLSSVENGNINAFGKVGV